MADGYSDPLIGRPGGGVAGTTGKIPDPSGFGSSITGAMKCRMPGDPSILKEVCANKGDSDSWPDADVSMGETGINAPLPGTEGNG